jgi:hypothetical protein
MENISFINFVIIFLNKGNEVLKKKKISKVLNSMEENSRFCIGDKVSLATETDLNILEACTNLKRELVYVIKSSSPSGRIVKLEGEEHPHPYSSALFKLIESNP